MLQIENESLVYKLAEAQAEIFRYKTDEFERQLTSLSELWHELDVKTNGGQLHATHRPQLLDRDQLIQVLKEVRTMMNAQPDVEASGESLDGARHYLHSCSAMERREIDPDIKAKLERSVQEARDIFRSKIHKHLKFYREESLNKLHVQIGSALQELDGGTGSVAVSHDQTQINADTINQILNELSCMSQVGSTFSPVFNNHNGNSK